jgi:hypothetical protein
VEPKAKLDASWTRNPEVDQPAKKFQRAKAELVL